ncbi:MAG: hypothetical protein AB7K64_02825 [Variibacter sp.]
MNEKCERPKGKARAERLAAALKANLRKRKAQARARMAPEGSGEAGSQAREAATPLAKDVQKDD